MADPLARLRRFLRELKRRKVYRVAVVYAGVAFVTLQAARLIFPTLAVPGWVFDTLVVLVLFGFPIALVLAWAFEMTPEGVRRTADAEGAPEPESMSPEERRTESRLAMKALVGLGLLGAVVAGGWYLMGGGGEPEPRVTDRSIAVLPFENMGGEESEQFTQGVHDDLLTRLSNISGLKVISRTSVMRYEDSDMALPQIAGELGVKWIVEGGVQQVSDQIKVNAQLIQAENDAHQWAETYRRRLTTENLFAVQAELTKKIAGSLEAELSPEEQRRIEREPTQDLGAYRLYAKGRRQLDRRTKESVAKAAGYFERALKRDSTFGRAWAGLAEVTTTPFFVGEVDALPRLAPDLPDPERAARRALQLDPDLPEGHTALGYVHFERRDAPAALGELRRAVELKPSSANAHYLLGFTYLIVGRLPPAIEHLTLAEELNPLHRIARHSLGDAYLAAGQAERSLEVGRRYRRRLAGMPEEASPIWMEARALYELDRFEDARRVLREGLSERREAEGRPGPPWHHHLTAVEAAVGDTARARRHLARLEEMKAPPHLLAVAYAAVGERDSAFAAYDRVEDWTWVAVLELRYSYIWSEALDPLRDDPRYQALIRRANVAWGLNPDGSLPDSVDVSLDSEDEPDG